MRRSLALRIVAFIALLGLVGLVSSGCTGYFTIVLEWRPLLFDEFVYWIGREDSEELAEFYASQVYVSKYDDWLERWQIEQEWYEYFQKYEIVSSYLGEARQENNNDTIATVRVTRYEERRPVPYGSSELIEIRERYTLRKDGAWRITGVTVLD